MEPYELCDASGPLPASPFAQSPPADDFLAMQLLLSPESGSVCRTHSGQHLKHLVQKTTEVLIFMVAK